MKENKFLKLVKTLDKEEVKAFQKYLNGLYGKQEKMILLFKYFYTPLKKGKEITLPTEDFLQTKLFKEKQTAKVVSNLFSKLYLYLEEFLRWQKINADANNYTKDKLQIEIYKERKLNDWFYTRLEKVKKDIGEAPMDMWCFLKLFELNHTTYFQYSTEKHKSNTIELLSDCLTNLDTFYIAAKLKYACEIESTAKFNINTIDNWLIDHILNQYSEKISAHPFFKTYNLILNLLINEKDTEYDQLKNEFLQNRQTFGAEDQNILLTILLNFVIKKIKEGNLDASKEIFELYKIGVEEKILIANNEIGAIPFFNIINVACRLAEIDWAEQFLENYSIYLNKKDKSEIKKLARSIIYFQKGEYDEVLIALRGIKFKNIFYETRARALIIRSLIEQKANKYIIQAECDSFSQSLRRNELLKDQLLTAYVNFVRLTRMIYVNTTTTKKQLQDFLAKERLFVYKDWLLKKVENFKGPS